MNQPIARVLVGGGCAAALVAGAGFGLGQVGAEPMGKLAGAVLIVLGSVVVLGPVWAAAAGYGWLLRRALVPGMSGSAAATLGLGMAALLGAQWLLAWAGAVGAAWGWGLCGVGAAAAIGQMVVSQRKRQEQAGPRGGGAAKKIPTPDRSDPARLGARGVWGFWPMIGGMFAVGAALVAACCPPGTLWRVEAFGYDVLSYHLQLPKQWLAAGRMTGLTHNVYSYFPNLIESGYLLLGEMRGSMLGAVYDCQLLHLSLGLLAAAAVGELVWGAVSRSGQLPRPGAAAGRGGEKARGDLVAASAAGAVMVSLPWVMITGTLAYDEMGMLAFAAAALGIALSPTGATRRQAAAVGFLGATATLAKLPAGPMLALPIGGVLILRLSHAGPRRPPPSWHITLGSAAIAAAVGFATLGPWLVRNQLETGNPVFPFATARLGYGHWDKALARRWDRAHERSESPEGALASLGRQGVFNMGYGAIGGRAVKASATRVARFPRAWGVPVFWGAVVIGAGALVAARRRMPNLGSTGLAMGLMLGVQVVFWLFFTHRQSRFLLPTVLPGSVLLGLGLAALWRMGKAGAAAGVVIAAGLPVTMGLLSVACLWSLARPLPTQRGGGAAAGPWVWVDSLDRPGPGHAGGAVRGVSGATAGGTSGGVNDHPVNRLPPDGKTLIVADNGWLFYMERPIVYASAFDRDPLGQVVRRVGKDPAAITAALRRRGITDAWVSLSEARRLRATYGADPVVTMALLKRLTRYWVHLGPGPLFAVRYRGG